jgi:hypothetical protein
VNANLSNYPQNSPDTVQIGVRQFLAQNDPDVDAIYRLTSTVPFDFRLFYFYVLIQILI